MFSKHVSPNSLMQSIIKLLNFTYITKLGIFFPMYISKLGQSFYHLMNFKKVIEPTFCAKNQFSVNDELKLSVKTRLSISFFHYNLPKWGTKKLVCYAAYTIAKSRRTFLLQFALTVNKEYWPFELLSNINWKYSLLGKKINIFSFLWAEDNYI